MTDQSTLRTDLGTLHLDFCRKKLTGEFLPRILTCLNQLSDKEIWWRPNEASNSAGNLILHLSGNVTQWIITGLGGAADIRNRPAEFSEKGPIPREALIRRISEAVQGADAVIEKFDIRKLHELRRIQVFDVTALEAITTVVEHFAYHLGQLVYLTKLQKGKDLRFYDL